jgi:hypothetical protein
LSNAIGAKTILDVDLRNPRVILHGLSDIAFSLTRELENEGCDVLGAAPIEP